MASTLEMPLEDRVHHALRLHPQFCRRRLRFEACDGRVTLRGIVGSYYQKQMAQEMIRRVDGVDQIENQLQVDWSQGASAPGSRGMQAHHRPAAHACAARIAAR